jgi:hypothetical protein
MNRRQWSGAILIFFVLACACSSLLWYAACAGGACNK